MGKVLKFLPRKNIQHDECWVKKVSGSDITDAEAISMAKTCEEFSFSRHDENKKLYLVDPAKSYEVNGLIDIKSQDYEKHEIVFNKYTDKSEIITNIRSNILSDAKFRRVREDLVLSADELFTNFSKSALNTEEMKMIIELDNTRVSLFCEDSFGSLDPVVMLENIARCYKKGIRHAIKKEAGGAGIGSYLMFRISTGMTIYVEAGKKTMVGIWMPLRVHHEDRLDLNKEFYIVKKQEIKIKKDS